MAKKLVKPKRSSSLDRRLSVYPHPKYVSLFVAYAHENLTSKPKTAEAMIKKFLDDLPEPEKTKLRALYDKMTPEQKRRTETIKED